MNQEENLKEVQGTLQSYKIQSKLGIDLHQKSSFNGSTPMAIPSAGSDSKGKSGKHIFDNSNSNNRDFIKMSPFISTPIESNLMNIVSSPMPSNHAIKYLPVANIMMVSRTQQQWAISRHGNQPRRSNRFD